MTDTKAMAVAALLLAGAVVRIELGKAGKSDPDAWWLGHLDLIAELLRPSPQVAAQAQTITRLREALDAIASPGATKDYGWWTETARAALSPGGETPERPVR